MDTLALSHLETEEFLRDQAVKEAEDWIETPFHHAARIKGLNGGVDCLMILVEVYHRIGLIEKLQIPHYPPDWHMHRDIERYIEGLADHADEVQEPVKGGVAVYKFGRCYSHGVIVTEWPMFIHAYWNARQVLRGSNDLYPFKEREVKFFDPISKYIRGQPISNAVDGGRS